MNIPPNAGMLAQDLRINLTTLKWCIDMTAHVHRGPHRDPLEENSLLSYPEVDAVCDQFGHLTGTQIEAEFADKQGQVADRQARLDSAQDELARLISTFEAADRCGVAESTIRGWVHRRRLTPAEYRDGLAYFRQVDVHRVNEASKARAATIARQPQPRFTDKDQALNLLSAAVAACVGAGLTDIPVLVQDILDQKHPGNS